MRRQPVRQVRLERAVVFHGAAGEGDAIAELVAQQGLAEPQPGEIAPPQRAGDG